MLQNMTYLTFHCRYGQMSIHRGCIDALKRPVCVQVLVNDQTRQLALRGTNAHEKDAFVVPESIYAEKATFGINGAIFVEKIRQMMGWRRNCAYRVDGILQADGIMLFTLDSFSSLEDWREETAE